MFCHLYINIIFKFHWVTFFNRVPKCMQHAFIRRDLAWGLEGCRFKTKKKKAFDVD